MTSQSSHQNSSRPAVTYPQIVADRAALALLVYYTSYSDSYQLVLYYPHDLN